jgi:hypothetical protein
MWSELVHPTAYSPLGAVINLMLVPCSATEAVTDDTTEMAAKRMVFTGLLSRRV